MIHSNVYIISKFTFHVVFFFFKSLVLFSLPVPSPIHFPFFFVVFHNKIWWIDEEMQTLIHIFMRKGKKPTKAKDKWKIKKKTPHKNWSKGFNPITILDIMLLRPFGRRNVNDIFYSTSGNRPANSWHILWNLCWKTRTCEHCGISCFVLWCIFSAFFPFLDTKTQTRTHTWNRPLVIILDLVLLFCIRDFGLFFPQIFVKNSKEVVI